MVAVESWKLAFDGRYPIYEQIVNELCRSLVKGEVQPGERIPSIRDMALALQVNTNTIQRAYQEMERRQIIFSQRGTGYFVMENEALVQEIRRDMVQTSMQGFVENMKSLGFKPAEILDELQQYMKEEK